MKRHGNRPGKTGKWFLAWGLLLASALPNARAEDEGEYDFSWLDQDKKIYVLQNRKYRKAGHALISLMGGVGWSNPYRDTKNFDPRLAYYFSENLGIETFYGFTSNSENTTYENLRRVSPNALPVVREIRSQYGLLMHWAPWYAKINVFNTVLYFDWYFSAGVGNLVSYVDVNTRASGTPTFEQKNLFAIFLGTGHQFHLSQLWVVRFDITGAYYRAPAFGNEGGNQWFSNYNFSAGIGIRP